MQELREKAIEKMENDMFFCFEFDEQEKAQAYEQINDMKVQELDSYIYE